MVSKFIYKKNKNNGADNGDEQKWNDVNSRIAYWVNG